MILDVRAPCATGGIWEWFWRGPFHLITFAPHNMYNNSNKGEGMEGSEDQKITEKAHGMEKSGVRKAQN